MPGRKKKRDEFQTALQNETADYVGQFLTQHPSQQQLLGFERTFRDLIFASAGKLLQPVIQALVDQFDASFQAGPTQRLVERRHLEVTGLFGPMHIFRAYYSAGQNGFCPADNALGLEGAYTPALSRIMLRAAAKNSYAEASADLFEYAGVTVCDRQIQRLVHTAAPAVGPWLEKLQDSGPVSIMYISGDGTGVPMRKEELEGRRGKQADGSAKTREVKLGCVFLQAEVDPKGHPVRKEASTSYVGTFEGAAEFGLLLRQEARRRGLGRAVKVVFIGDGAAWVWELARVNFPGAILILDFYHALQHVHGLVAALWDKDSPEGRKACKRWIAWLLKDKANQIVSQAKDQLARALDTEHAQGEIGYLEHNLPRMCYGTFRKAGYFIGSGVVEAGCKTVVGKRMKCSGMFWSEEGGQGILDLRCAFLSNRLDAFCHARASAHLAQEHPLKLAA